MARMATKETVSQQRKCLVKPGKSKAMIRIDVNLPSTIEPDTNDSHSRPDGAKQEEFHLLNHSNPTSIQYIAGTIKLQENDREVTKRIVVKRIKLENLGFFGKTIARFKEELLRLKFLKNNPYFIGEYRSFYETKDGKPIVFYSITERMDHSLDMYFDFLRRTDETEKEKKRDHRHVSAFLTQTLRILDFLHSRGVIHGNISPSKIGMNKQHFQLKLLDFGKRSFRKSNLDEEIQSTGLPLYEAPEALFMGNHLTKSGKISGKKKKLIEWLKLNL